MCLKRSLLERESPVRRDSCVPCTDDEKRRLQCCDCCEETEPWGEGSATSCTCYQDLVYGRNPPQICPSAC
ncbi:unnamed protein product, partial [Timema podura]|nr:unnamed protein product [Timema podura]